MAVSDPVADMLTRIRNAIAAQKPTVDIPASNLKRQILDVFQRYNFIKKYVVVEDNGQGTIKVLLNYNNGEPTIQGIERLSKPGSRKYSSAKNMPRVLSGLGFALVSTSKGILTDQECRQQNVGGELLCKIW